MTQLWKLTPLQYVLLAIWIITPSYSYATPYNVSGLFDGAYGATEVYGTLSINNTFSSSTIETAWQNYLASSTQDNFFLELDYQITSFDLYRVDTGESFFHGDTGEIEVIVTGFNAPEATGYSAWYLQGSGSVFCAYSPRSDWNDVIFSNNGINVTDYEYDQLPQMIQLNNGFYNDDIYNTSVSLTLTRAQPIPEPNTLLLIGLGTLLLIKKRKNSNIIS